MPEVSPEPEKTPERSVLIFRDKDPFIKEATGAVYEFVARVVKVESVQEGEASEEHVGIKVTWRVLYAGKTIFVKDASFSGRSTRHLPAGDLPARRYPGQYYPEDVRAEAFRRVRELGVLSLGELIRQEA